MIGQYKKIIIAIIVMLVIAIGYKILSKDVDNVADNFKRTSATPDQTAENTLGKDIVTVLKRIDGIELNRSIFSDKVYKYLVSKLDEQPIKEIADQPLGDRGDIFSPYNSSAAGAPER